MRKNIVVLFSNLGDITSIAKQEAMVASIIRDMRQEGKEVFEMKRDSKSRSYTFTDGSRLFVHSFGISLRGHRITHLYVDQEAVDMAGGKEYIQENVFPFMMLEEDDFVEYDVAAHPDTRVKVFDFNSSKKLETNYYFKG